MITCEHCGKVYKSNVTPLHCRCGGVTGKYIEPVKPIRYNAWHTLHTRYANATRSDQWHKQTEQQWLDFDFAKLIPCGSCGNKWLEIRPLMDLSTPEAAFRSAWQLHNRVSQQHLSPPKQAITYEHCRAIYLGERINRLCVVTLATGQAVPILEISRQSIADYARRCGADYIELCGTTESWWGLEKFRLHKIAQAFDRTLFLDCDVLIGADCPSLFDVAPSGSVAMHDDCPYLSSVQWLEDERKTVFESQTVEGSYPKTCLNSGVVLCSREHADIWTRPKDPFPTSHCAEQIWIEFLAGRFPIFQLPTEFNTQFWMRDFANLKESASILHWANCKDKATEMLNGVKLHF